MRSDRASSSTPFSFLSPRVQRLVGAGVPMIVGLVIALVSIPFVIGTRQPLVSRVGAAIMVLFVAAPLLGGGFWVWFGNMDARRRIDEGVVPRSHWETAEQYRPSRAGFIGLWAILGTVTTAGFAGLFLVFEMAQGAETVFPELVLVWAAGLGTLGGGLVGLYDGRRAVEQARTRSAADWLRQYERAIEGTHDLIAAADEEGNYLFANESYREYHDLDLASLGETSLEDVFEADELEQIWEHFERALDGEDVTFRMTRSLQDGGPSTFDVRYSPLADESGSVRGVVTTIRDVSALVSQQQELERSRDLLSQTERLADVGGWELDVETDELRWTDGVRRLHDLPESFEPTLAEAMAFYHPEDRETVSVAVENCRTEGIAYDLEARIVTDDGRTRNVHVTGARFSENGQQLIRGAIRDITDRKQREQRLMVLNRVLRHNLRNNLSAIIGYADVLGEELERIDELSSFDGDETRAAFSAQVGELGEVSESLNEALSDLADQMDRLESLPSEEASRGPTLIKRNSDALIDIAQKVQLVERRTDDDQIIESIALHPLVSDLIDSYSQDYPDATLELAGDEAAVRGNTDAVRAILDELLENALEHAVREEPSVWVRVEAGPETVEIRVQDDGPGIPEMDRSAIEQGQEMPLMHGSGIGLWLVHWLVTRLGGQVTIASRDPRGSVVTVELPGAHSSPTKVAPE